MVAVKPAALLPLPEVYTHMSEALSTNFNNCDLAVLGSPINKTLISPLNFMPSGKSLEVPPKSKHAIANLISSWP